jgi:hypothetical protein
MERLVSLDGDTVSEFTTLAVGYWQLPMCAVVVPPDVTDDGSDGDTLVEYLNLGHHKPELWLGYLEPKEAENP